MKHLPNSSRVRRGQSGFSLIEVLLAVAVLAIGLLAGSRMQMLGLNYTQGGMIRSHAILAANDILDRIRLNREEAVLNGAYDAVATSNGVPADPGCMSAGCTAAEIALVDIREWGGYFGLGDQTATSTPLRNAVGTITRNTDEFTVTISWTELVGGDSENRRIEISARL